MLWVDPEPFESPFDRLTVLSHSVVLMALRASKGNVEGLTAPSKIEGGNRWAEFERCRRVNRPPLTGNGGDMAEIGRER